MALSSGTVTIDSNGNASGTGLALALYNARTWTTTTYSDAALQASADATLLRLKTARAEECTAMASAIVDEITTNAEVGGVAAGGATVGVS